MLSIRGLSKHFYGVDVLNGINLDIKAGEVVGLIGRSGAGKSTLARCLVGLETLDQGEIHLNGSPIEPGQGYARQHIQYLWQDPTQALSPYLTARAAVIETLSGFRIGTANKRRSQAEEILNDLGLDQATILRRPHSLSGGQCQRVALARAVAAEPEVLILDEPFSSLDLATQISTIHLLRRVHAKRKPAMLIVSHDLAPLRQLADRIAVLDDAHIVEDIALDEFTAKASHPLSRAYAGML